MTQFVIAAGSSFAGEVVDEVLDLEEDWTMLDRWRLVGRNTHGVLILSVLFFIVGLLTWDAVPDELVRVSGVVSQVAKHPRRHFRIRLERDDVVFISPRGYSASDIRFLRGTEVTISIAAGDNGNVRNIIGMSSGGTEFVSERRSLERRSRDSLLSRGFVLMSPLLWAAVGFYLWRKRRCGTGE